MKTLILILTLGNPLPLRIEMRKLERLALLENAMAAVRGEFPINELAERAEQIRKRFRVR